MYKEENRILNNETQKVLVYIMFSFVLSRVIIYFVCGIVLGDFSPASIIDSLNIWDAGWYRGWVDYILNPDRQLHFGENGQVIFNFFPAYPMAVSILCKITLNKVPVNIIGSLLSSCFFCIAEYYVYKYCKITNRLPAVAYWYIFFLSFGLYSFYFSVLLTESMFLMLLIMCYFYMESGQYIKMGLCGAVLSAVRSTGILFCLVVFVYVVCDVWKKKDVLEKRACIQKNVNQMSLLVMLFIEGLKYVLSNWRLVIGVCLIPIGLWSYMFYLYIVTGDAIAFVHTQNVAWGHQFKFILINIWQAIWGGTINYLSGSMIISLMLILFCILEGNVCEGIYPLMVIMLIGNTADLWGTPRYMIGAFTVLLVFTDYISKLPFKILLIIGGLIMFIEMAMVKYYILGNILLV